MFPLHRSGYPRPPDDLDSDAYLSTLGGGATHGPLLTAGDVSGARHVAVVNQALVVRHFGSENPIGQTIRLTRLATLPELVPRSDLRINC